MAEDNHEQTERIDIDQGNQSDNGFIVLDAPSEDECPPSSIRENSRNAYNTVELRKQEHEQNRQNKKDAFSYRLILIAMGYVGALVVLEGVLSGLNLNTPSTLATGIEIFKFVISAAIGYAFGQSGKSS